MAEDSALRVMATEDHQNRVFDPLRVAFMISFATGICLQIYTVVWQGNAFDFSAFGTGAGIMIGGTGVGLFASSNQKEPAK